MTTKKPLTKVECSGGCGKFQMTRKTRGLAAWDAVGCGKCDGWRALEAKKVPEGMVRVFEFNALAGFHAFRVRVATAEERAAIARARWLRDTAIGSAPPTSETLQ